MVRGVLIFIGISSFSSEAQPLGRGIRIVYPYIIRENAMKIKAAAFRASTKSPPTEKMKFHFLGLQIFLFAYAHGRKI